MIISGGLSLLAHPVELHSVLMQFKEEAERKRSKKEKGCEKTSCK